jgi:hypothetical protein
MQFDWPYYDLINGRLYITQRPRGLPVAAFPHSNPPRFANAAEAEAWLVAQDIRGNVREADRKEKD